MAQYSDGSHESRRQPLYARVLGLRHIHPGEVLCFLFFEFVVVAAVVLALIGFVSWWGVLVLPLTVAAMVKLNDVVAGLVRRPAVPPTSRSDRSD